LYQQIIYMSLGGWLVFGQIPDTAVVLGAGIVVLSGLYLLWREFSVAQKNNGGQININSQPEGEKAKGG
jgi:drug/metabolite transporter (DMT)-like permease